MILWLCLRCWGLRMRAINAERLCGEKPIGPYVPGDLGTGPSAAPECDFPAPSTRSARFALGTMFIDLDTLDLHELQTLADSLPSPHTWAHGIDDIFYCLACHASFVWGEPVPEGPYESDPELLKHQGAVTIDGIDLDDFTKSYGRRVETHRRLAEAGLKLGRAYDVQ